MGSNFANQFTTGKSSVDTALGIGVPIAANALAPGAGGIIAQLMKHPLWGSIMGNIGTGFLRRMLGSELPYGDFAQEQLGAISGMIPELQAGARGEPTAASRAIKDQVRTEGQRMQQSFATGARQRGLVGGLPGGTAPFAAQQGRVQAATQAAMTQRLGAHQDASQAALLGLAPTAFQHAGIQQTADRAAEGDLMGSLGRFNREFVQNKFDPQFQEMLAFIKAQFGL